MDGAAPLRVPPGAAIRSTCPYCGVGCGVLLRRDGAGISVAGDPEHPANRGRLCSKGAALHETVGLEGRLLHPKFMGERATWDAALSVVAERFRDTIDRHGPDSVAFYVSGQMLTEDYYVANKLMKGFIGSANIDTNSRLCMASTVAGHRRAFGTDTVPGLYEDLELADLVVLVGSNLAWCHPVLFQRLAAAKAARPGMRVVTVDPRRTNTTDLADLHLGIAPGSDVALFNRLLAEIVQQGAVDADYVRRHIDGFDEAVARAQAGSADACGLPEAELTAFLRLWLRTEKVVTVFSQGVNQSSAGTDKVNAILNCHLATGRIGRPGMGPFSVTGQPNAMGGREVGGLANTLAAHLDIENPAHREAVQGFWQAPTMPRTNGPKAVEMFQRIAEGRIKALWVICTNPAVSLPDTAAVQAAIAGCNFVVVSDLTDQTATARLAHVVLPATGWGEKDGTVTNSERCISRQRPLLPPPGEARHDWDILADVGRRMGHAAAFAYASPAQVFREHAALSGLAGGFGRDFDISGLAGLSDADYDALEPVRWPLTASRSGGRFFGDGRFFTPNGRARMVAVAQRGPVATPTDSHPFRLNTGRVRDHWHTMTRTGKSARLSQHLAEPFLEINPTDARRLGIEAAHLVEVTSPTGRALLRALITERVRRGEVFAPIHWTPEVASASDIGSLIPAEVDPVSGQPESKASVVHLAPYPAAWYGFAVAASDLAPGAEYWATARVEGGWRAELAGAEVPADWEAYARRLFGLPGALAVTFGDSARGLARVALLDQGRLVAALFVAPEPVAVARGHLAGLLGQAAPGALAGRPAGDMPDPGPVLCSCFGVGVTTILTAIETQALTSVEAVGAAVRAGSNCGSCRPEIKALLASVQRREAAE